MTNSWAMVSTIRGQHFSSHWCRMLPLAVYPWADWTMAERPDHARITGPCPSDWTMPASLDHTPYGLGHIRTGD